MVLKISYLELYLHIWVSQFLAHFWKTKCFDLWSLLERSSIRLTIPDGILKKEYSYIYYLVNWNWTELDVYCKKNLLIWLYEVIYHIAWIMFQKIAKSFNKNYIGIKSLSQKFVICFAQNPISKGLNSLCHLADGFHALGDRISEAYSLILWRCCL